MTPNENEKDNFNLELYFELSPDLLCIAGFDGYFKRINPTVSKTLGYTNQELFSRPINDFVHPDDQQLTIHSRSRVHGNVPLMNFENRYLTKSGEIVWLSWTSMPIDAEQVVFAIAKVVTHRKKLEEERMLEIAKLTELNNNLKQLTYTTSHNLRSPVGNLLSVFEMMDTTKIEDEETLEFIEMLRIATENLKDTLNGYVDALSQRGVLQVQIEEIDILECANTVWRLLKSLIAGSKTKITMDFTVFDKLHFNKAYLESVFLNLITNSIKYTKPHIDPVINIYTRYHNGFKQLVFEDQGQGFDMEKVGSKVFGFNQKFHDRADSKGIGLYLVYNHISSLGGKIALESEPDKGARFILTFMG